MDKNKDELEEIDKQTNIFLENNKIKDYILTKPITKDHSLLFKHILN
jgi:hypothetical protein